MPLPLKSLEKIPPWAWLALALRVGFALKLGNNLHQIDEIGYSGSAWELASLGILGVAPPVPNAFFAVFFLLGHHLLWPRLGQALVSTATVWMLGRMTRELTGSSRAQSLALAVSAIYPFFIYYSGMLMSETLYLALVVAGLWWLCQCLSDRGRVLWRAGACGLALGLAALCRAEGAPIAVLIWIAAGAAAWAGRWPWKNWALAVLCWSLPLTLWCWRNQAATGHFVMDTHGGITMLHGTLLLEQNERDTAYAQKALEGMEFYQKAQSLGEYERNQVYMSESFRFMRENPRLVLSQWGRKFVNFWRFYPRRDKVYVETPYNNPNAGLSRDALALISLLFEPALIFLGLAGLWKLRGRWHDFFPLWIFIAATMAVHVISVSQMRYRLSIMPFLIFGACVYVASLVGEAVTQDGY